MSWTTSCHALSLLLGLTLSLGSAAEVCPLTNGDAASRYPAWSPSGEWIAFESHRSGNWDLWLLEPSSGVVRQVTADPASDRHPAWVAGGTSLVFVSDRGGVPDIRRATPLTTRSRRYGTLEATSRAP